MHSSGRRKLQESAVGVTSQAAACARHHACGSCMRHGAHGLACTRMARAGTPTWSQADRDLPPAQPFAAPGWRPGPETGIARTPMCVCCPLLSASEGSAAVGAGIGGAAAALASAGITMSPSSALRPAHSSCELRSAACVSSSISPWLFAVASRSWARRLASARSCAECQTCGCSKNRSGGV